MRAKAFFLIALLTIILFPLQALPNDCEKACKLYNKAAKSNDLKEQERLYQEAISIPCDNNAYKAFFHNNLADTYEKSKRFKEAEIEYQEAIKLDPEFLLPYISLGDLYSKMEKTEGSDAYYSEYLQRYFLKIRKRICELQIAEDNIRAIKVVPTLTIYFDCNDGALTKEAQKQLEGFYSKLKKDEFTTYKLGIIDHKGSEKGNSSHKPSKKGAEAVKKWLVAHGYAADDIQISGLENNESIIKDSKEGRRVEIRVVGYIVKEIMSRPKWKEGIDLIEQGDRYCGMEEYNEAAFCFEKAQALFEQEKLTVGSAAALGSLYFAYLKLEDGERANESLKAFKATMEDLPFDCSGGSDH